MLVKEAVMASFSRRSTGDDVPWRSGQALEHVGRRHPSIVAEHLRMRGAVHRTGRVGDAVAEDEGGLEAAEQLAQLGRGREVLLLDDGDRALDPETRRKP